jgi:hypothetical protein
MAATDRAFRALGRDEPHTLVALVRQGLPDLIPADDEPGPMTALDARLDIPDPSLEVDAVLSGEGGVLWHIEGQGYGERTFAERLLR